VRKFDWLVPLISLLVLCAYFSFSAPSFLTVDNWRNVARQASPIAVLAVGVTLVIILGGIDLSLGSVMALSGVVAAMVMQRGAGIVAGIAAGLGVGVVCGLFSGVLTTQGRMPSFIVTLGVMLIAGGMALEVTGGVNVSGLPSAFTEWSNLRFLGVPSPVVLTFILAAAAQLVLSLTHWGRHFYAIGGNKEAARLSGIRVNLMTTLVFTACGLTSGIGGVMLSSLIGLGQPTAGKTYELYAIAAAVMGGTSLMGGRGTVVGTMIGALFIQVVRNGCNLLNVPSGRQDIYIGIVFILAVLYDHLSRRRER
jgi:ribose/xylose/arabinose/galactoside ABC-type transport system permease subunit